MKETGIIMSGNHPKLIIDCLKTMTRRTRGLEKINESPDLWEYIGCFTSEDDGKVYHSFRNKYSKTGIINVKCHYGQAGDQLWVRETWATENRYNHLKPSEIPRTATIFYLASIDYDPFGMGKKRPSIFMPRWASRITREITGLRAERLQEISEDDAEREGENWEPSPIRSRGWNISAVENFSILWDSLNAKRGYGWETNPWVWPIEFNAVGIRIK